MDVKVCKHDDPVIGGICLGCREPVPGVVHRAAKRATDLSQASARRELWREATRMPDWALINKITLYVYLTTSESAKMVRPGNIQRVDLWYLRMYRTEQRRRGISAF